LVSRCFGNKYRWWNGLGSYRCKMTSTDPDRARSRFISAVQRIIGGARLCRERVLAGRNTAPKLLANTPYEVVNLTGVPPNDLDYYTYELGRLQDTAREVNKAFGSPQEVVSALSAFEDAVPRLREARNPLTHPSDDARLDDVGSFSALVRLDVGGGVVYLVDPRHEHHDAAERLAAELLRYLRRS